MVVVLDCDVIDLVAVTELVGTLPLSLLLVDELHQDSLVLEHIALCVHVKVVVHMMINLVGLPVLAQQSPQNTYAANPDGFLWHTTIGSTFPLAIPPMSVLPPCFISVTYTSTTMFNLGLFDDQFIFDKFSDVLTRISIGNLIGLIGGLARPSFFHISRHWMRAAFEVAKYS